MKLGQWVKEQLALSKQQGSQTTNRAVLETLARRAGVSYMTLAPVAKGSTLSIYMKARAVSEATDWQVTIPELCENDPAPEIVDQFAVLRVNQVS